MIYTKITKIAMRIAYDAHKEQVDKSGIPYIFHPMHLSEQMTDEPSCVVALLHDVLEDTPLTLSDLLRMGIPKKYTDILALMTHDDTIPYMEYIRALAHNSVARRVKMADLRHNIDRTRLDEIDECVLLREEKYREALAILETVEKEESNL